MDIFEYGYTTLVSLGFTIVFNEESVTVTKRHGSITVDDVKLISTYVKPQYRYMVFKSDYQVITIS